MTLPTLYRTRAFGGSKYDKTRIFHSSSPRYNINTFRILMVFFLKLYKKCLMQHVSCLSIERNIMFLTYFVYTIHVFHLMILTTDTYVNQFVHISSISKHVNFFGNKIPISPPPNKMSSSTRHLDFYISLTLFI